MTDVYDADLMGIGAHCNHPECHQLDFLPYRCNGCSKIFCQEHRRADAHACPHAADGDVQVIICPRCAQGIKLVPKEDPNVTFERHSATACDPNNYNKVHKKKRCPVKNCKEKLISTNSIQCKDCGVTLCLKHRLPEDHSCPGPQVTRSTAAGLRATLGGFFSGPTSKPAAAKAPVKRPVSASATAPPPPSRLASAKSKLSAAAQKASSSVQSQLNEYRAAHQSKTGRGTTATASAVSLPELCTECGQRFATVQALIDHAGTAHANGWQSGSNVSIRPAAGGAIERCPHCQAEFADPVALVQHVESTHSSQPTEVCVLI